MFGDIAIDLWFSWNFVSIKDVIRTCNLTIRFSKFTLNINIYDEFVGFLSKLVWRETLFFVLCGTNADFYVNDTYHIGSNECDM